MGPEGPRAHTAKAEERPPQHRGGREGSRVARARCGGAPIGLACSHLFLSHGGARTVGTKEPPTQDLDVNGKTRKAYDASLPAGASAINLLASWGMATTPDMPAPWRQTGGGGGSEFGKPKWLAALKDGYKTADEPPRFTLWQLALADSVVRFLVRKLAYSCLTRLRVARPSAWCAPPTPRRLVQPAVRAAQEAAASAEIRRLSCAGGWRSYLRS